MRISDPYAELAVKNQKYVKNCTELYLAKRQINQLGNFEAFVNLEVLWINDNAIEKLSQLDQCFRIKFLYAQNNQIRTLENSSVQFFKFLKELRLYNNKLQDLHTNLKILSTHNQYLEDLDLFGNPLAEEENYRLYVIKALPSLLVLDRHVVTEEERNKANK
jgi:Leucine-rich repeat (LRR) protein